MRKVLKHRKIISIKKMNEVWLTINLDKGLFFTLEGGFEYSDKSGLLLTSNEYAENNFSNEFLNKLNKNMVASEIIESSPEWESGILELKLSNGGCIKIYPEDETLDAWALHSEKGVLYEVSSNRGIQSY